MPLTRRGTAFRIPAPYRLADAIIINSQSLRSEIKQYLDVDERKLRLIYEAVDHELSDPVTPRRRGRCRPARA